MIEHFVGLSYWFYTYHYCPSLGEHYNEWYVDHPDLGHRRLVILLNQEGWAINIKRVRWLRALMSLETQFPRPNLSKPGVPRQRFFYLLRGLVIHSVHQVWATDITYIPMPKGFFYVMAILDLYSRYVLHWQLSNTLEADWCVDTLRQSLQQWGNRTAEAAADIQYGSRDSVYE